jgi:hypothetical protein
VYIVTLEQPHLDEHDGVGVIHDAADEVAGVHGGGRLFFDVEVGVVVAVLVVRRAVLVKVHRPLVEHRVRDDDQRRLDRVLHHFVEPVHARLARFLDAVIFKGDVEVEVERRLVLVDVQLEVVVVGAASVDAVG